MKRTWLAGLIAAPLLLAQATTSCTTEQDLGDRPGDDGGPPNGEGGGDAPAPMRVFVTKSSFTGDLQTAARRYSGLEAADALCQLAADGATIGGHWAAWLSDKNMDAIDRIDNDGPWINIPRPSYTSSKIFLDRAGIGAGPIDQYALNTEYGERCDESTCYYRSATSASGRTTGEDCASWSSTSSSSSSSACGAYQLLCLEQKVASYRKRVFVTSKAFTTKDVGYQSYEHADAFCADAAKTGNLGGRWRAWLSFGHGSVPRRAHDRLASRVSSWTLVDGTTVAFSSRDQLLSGPEHAIDRDERNQAVAANTLVWTTTTAKAAVSTDNCYDFDTQDDRSTGRVGMVGPTNGTWTDAQSIACNQAARLYCFEW